jgi:biotin carboxylase
MKTVLVVGSAFQSLKDYLSNNGYEFIVLKDKQMTKYPEKRFKRRVVCDFTSQDTILSTIKSIEQPIHAVIATYENYILPAAWIAEYLGVPGLPPRVAEACTDKYLMRGLFSKAPEKISPEFARVQNEEDLKNFAASHEFPLILKPANLAKSLLVTKNNSLEELLQNYKDALAQVEKIYGRYAPNRTPSMIVEEFLEGSIHSVDAFVDSKGTAHVLDQIVDYQTGYDIGYDDNFHYSRIVPSALSSENQSAIKHCAALGVQALGMKNTPAHIEIILTKNGPRLVEIGARNGGYRERMHGAAHGIDIFGNAIKLALGEQPNTTATKNDPMAVLELFPKTPGEYVGIANESALKNLPSCHYLSVKAKIGNYVGKSSGGYKMCAVVMLHNENADQFKKDLDFVNQKVRVLTK